MEIKAQGANGFITSIFPCPVYIVKRGSNLSTTEEREIRKIIKEGMYENEGNFTSNNTYIFDGKLKKVLEVAPYGTGKYP